MPIRFKRMNSIAMIILLLALLAGVRPAASAPQTQFGKFQTGDVLVSLGPSQVLWYDSGGKFIGTLFSKFEAHLGALAIDPAGISLYVTSVDQNHISLFDLSPEFIGEFGSGYDSGLISIVFDQEGNLYAAEYSTNANILKFDTAGNLIDKFNVLASISNEPPSFPVPIWIDLSVNQQTLFYTFGEREILYFDVFSGDPSPQVFATLPDAPNKETSAAAALRLLPPGDGSGGLLVADFFEIKRLDAFGETILHYDATEEDQWLSLSLNPDGKSFWAASAYSVYLFDIDRSEPLISFNAGNDASSIGQADRIWGLMVVGEPIAAQPTPTWTPTRTNTPITPEVRAPTNTFTPTPPVRVVVTTPPSSCTPPFCIYIPTPIMLGGGALILVAGLVVLTLIRRGLRKRSAKRSRTTSAPKRVRTLSHPDAGEQSVIPSSDAPSPQVRLSFKQGEADYEVESDGE